MWQQTEPLKVLLAAVLVCFFLATPFFRAAMESSMASHMLLQLPALAIAGYACGAVLPHATFGAKLCRALHAWNRGGATGLAFAGFVMIFWMLPRSLDVARLNVASDALKFLSVPVAGAAIALSWNHLPLIARGVVHLELIATFFRFGWGYLIAEDRLCLVYLAGDQKRTGLLLLWLGAAYVLIVVWRPVFGSSRRLTVVADS